MIHFGSYKDVISELDDSSVDLILTDPPYGTTDLSFDDGTTEGWFLDCERVLKDTGYLISFGPEDLLMEIGIHFQSRFRVSWVKSLPFMQLKGAKKPSSHHELIGVFCKKEAKVKDLPWNVVKRKGDPYLKKQNSRKSKREGKDQIDRRGFNTANFISENAGYRLQTDVIKAPNKPTMKHVERTPHPTQKPLTLLIPLIAWVTNPGDVVLDPFCGSGGTGIASKLLSREFIGIELDPFYVGLAEARIKDYERFSYALEDYILDES